MFADYHSLVDLDPGFQEGHTSFFGVSETVRGGYAWFPDSVYEDVEDRCDGDVGGSRCCD